MNPEPAFMRRALGLATLGRGSVSPNPMVGCVIVHDLGPNATHRVLGEGFTSPYGGPHAEVNAIRAVLPADEASLPEATAYVTLEPCSHFGKTPPCADLLIQKRIGRVICCNDDPNPLVAGRGFQKLREAGIEVITGLLEAEGRALNVRFFTFMEQKRPYVILKWAETADGFIGGSGHTPVAISGPLAGRLVHRWRSEEDAILVGKTTALHDNPRLNTRLWPGRSPVRIVLDRRLELPAYLHVFDGSQPTLVYHNLPGNVPKDRLNLAYAVADNVPELLTDLHSRRVLSVLVEGGAAVLGTFLNSGLWDEIRQFVSPGTLGVGVAAPKPTGGTLVSRELVGKDELLTWVRH
jgi:diaminohydroxyphosphoribosylaminopyrimidine deaminase / 5-amino-6-(5-phosphoribosylamino)uracil reductase